MKQVFVVTHTQSTHHVDGKVGGWHDSALTEQGERDAEATAKRLSDLVGTAQIELYSSDLRRAKQTAFAVSRCFGQQVVESAALREISYGEAEGRPQSWLDERYSFAPDDNRLDHHVGIARAETRRQVAERVFPFVSRVFDRPATTQIIVTHGFTLTLVLAAWMKIPIEAIGFLSFPAKSGSITTLRQDDHFRNRSVIALSDVSHLATN